MGVAASWCVVVLKQEELVDFIKWISTRKEHSEVISQDISQETEAWVQKGLLSYPSSVKKNGQNFGKLLEACERKKRMQPNIVHANF